jgi:hypothetical protein
MRGTVPMLLLAMPVWAQAGNGDVPVDADRLRGKLVQYEEAPAGNNALEPKAKNLPHIAGRLYHAGDIHEIVMQREERAILRHG